MKRNGMGLDSELVRAALGQQLRGDRLLGVQSVPLRPLPQGGGDHQTGGTPSQPAGPSAAETTEKTRQLRALDEGEVQACTKCHLSETRTKAVFGQGNPAARLVLVGEAPGQEEDRQGVAFVGRAGQLLTRMISAMGLSRDDVFICNVLKCRPPGNRDPSADEILACSPYLRQQLLIIQPEVLVALGAPAAKTLLRTSASIGKLRGRFHDYYASDLVGEAPPIPLMPTYHPAYLLRNPAEKRKAWEDLQMVMAKLGLKPPPS